MTKEFAILLSFFPIAAFADSPFTGVWRLEEPKTHPNTREAQYRALEDLLGIKHINFLLRSQPKVQTYAVRLEKPTGDGKKEILGEILMTSGDSVEGLGGSVLPASNSIRVKILHRRRGCLA